jgi:hypothetical protein
MIARIAALSIVWAAMTTVPLSFAGTLESKTMLGTVTEIQNDTQEIPSGSAAVPNQNVDENGERTGTLELRLENEVCRGAAHLVDLASRCQLVSSAPLQLK